MEIRNVQKTGKMHYFYLPTAWCKKYKINSSTKIYISETSDGSLIVSPREVEKKKKKLDITLPSKYKDALINTIMACYVNPLDSFKITTDKKIDVASVLEQKNAISNLEFVELDNEHITYEASMTINDAGSLLKTMVKKVKNLVFVISENYDKSLILKYEEEIDRSKILIQKAVISSMVLNQPTKMKTIDLFYTFQIATELERIVDHVIKLEKKDKKFLLEVLGLIESMKEIIENLGKLDYIQGASFTKQVQTLKEESKDFTKLQIRRLFQIISEDILDWAITKMVEE